MAGYSRVDGSQARRYTPRSNSPEPTAHPEAIVRCDNAAMRFFNTSGPVVAADHYCIPPLARLSLDKVLGLVREKRYFVLHAPRQTGKTSVLLALKDELNRSGSYRCVYINVEVGQAAREDVGAATRSILNHTARRARSTLHDDFVANIWPEALSRAGPYNALEEVLGRWAEADPRPLVFPTRGDRRWRDGHDLGNVGGGWVREPGVAAGAEIVQGCSNRTQLLVSEEIVGSFGRDVQVERHRE